MHVHAVTSKYLISGLLYTSSLAIRSPCLILTQTTELTGLAPSLRVRPHQKIWRQYTGIQRHVDNSI